MSDKWQNHVSTADGQFEFWIEWIRA